ncbi:CD209 antigen-like protein E isoform X2 [Parambassis ranga]|uniref:CD209 antigen-like protein E isoform X2 n=1 Tax=Parambassis ranga TaxID=210632 RepID=A0A6P7HSB4_9TELE|nr:CD209 antigen-like protein E isoform X2 [Parambassis ranga]
MPEADVVYSDVRVLRLNGKAKEPISSSPDSTYSEVKILKQPSAEPSASADDPAASHPVASIRRSKVTAERVALLVVCVLMAATVIALCVTLVDNMRTKQHMECPKPKLKCVKVNLTETLKDEPCLMCEEGWEQHGGRCYYFYTKNSSWEKSRRFCKEKGGDLVKIDSREEQSFLDSRLSEIMMHAEDKFWIGLTDSQTEAAWTWVDGSPLNQSLTFWSKGEPDDWRRENSKGEDCVRMGEDGKSRDLKTWFDKSCDKPHRSVCEKSAE